MERAGNGDRAARVEDLLSEIDPEPSVDERRMRLHALADRVAEWGHRINLTGYRDAEGIFHGMVLDALDLFVAV